MPHPKNHMKLTGDIHPPEVEFDLDLDREEGDATGDDTSMGADTAGTLRTTSTQPERLQMGAAADRYFDAAREQVRARPYAMLGAAMALGFVLARMFR